MAHHILRLAVFHTEREHCIDDADWQALVVVGAAQLGGIKTQVLFRVGGELLGIGLDVTHDLNGLRRI